MRQQARDAEGEHVSHGMFVLTLANLAYVASGYVLTVVLARMLGPGSYATYGIATAVITVVQLLVARGVPVAATADASAHPHRAGEILAIAARGTAVAALVVGTAAAVFAVPLAILLDDPRALRSCLLVGSASAVTYGIHALLLARVNAARQFGRQAVAQVVYAAARVATVLGGAAAAGVRGAVVGFVLAPLLAAAALISRSRSHAPRPAAVTPGGESELPTARSYLVRSLPLVAAAAMVALMLSVDLFAYARVASDQAAGIYTAAGTIAHVPFFLLGSAPLVLLPAIARHGADPRAQRLAIQDGARATWALLAWPVVALVVAGDPLLPWLFGPDYATDRLVVAPLALATAGITVHASLIAVDTALGALRRTVTIGACGTVSIAVCAAFGASVEDATGAATGAALAAVVTALVHGWDVSRRTRANLLTRALTGPLVASLALAGPALLGRDLAPPLLLLLLAACTAVYVVLAVRQGWITLGRRKRTGEG